MENRMSLADMGISLTPEGKALLDATQGVKYETDSWSRRIICNTCGVLTGDMDIHTQRHNGLPEVIKQSIASDLARR